MTYLAASVVLLGVLTLLNLALVVGVIRRLREHSAHLTSLLEIVGPKDIMAAVGTQAADFTATTISSESVSSSDLEDRTLVGFFSPGCGSCTEQMPGFIAYAEAAPGGRRQTIAVIAADEAEAKSVFDLDQLNAVAQVVVEPSGGPLSKAFGVQAYPAMCMLSQDRLITASGSDIAMFATLSREGAHAG